VAVWTGLRVGELIGLKWDDVGTDSLTVDERCCRGDWDAPKSEASNATIGVESCVIDRINRLKLLTVEVRVGRAVISLIPPIVPRSGLLRARGSDQATVRTALE
jgi:hypothetical protein